MNVYAVKWIAPYKGQADSECFKYFTKEKSASTYRDVMLKTIADLGVPNAVDFVSQIVKIEVIE